MAMERVGSLSVLELAGAGSGANAAKALHANGNGTPSAMLGTSPSRASPGSKRVSFDGNVNPVVASALDLCSRAIAALDKDSPALEDLKALKKIIKAMDAQINTHEVKTLGEIKKWSTELATKLSNDSFTHGSGSSQQADDEMNEWLQATLGTTPVQSSTSTILCDAASTGDVATLRQMVEQGVSVDKGDYDKRTAIHLAASEGLLDVVKVLVEEFGADHSPHDRWGGTPLDDAIRSGHRETAEFLKAKGAERGRTAGVAGLSAPTDDRPATDLCEAAAAGDVAKLRRLVQEHDFKVNLGDYDKRTAIHLAASEGLLEVVKCLVEELGADHSPHDRWGNTPLDDAVRSGHSETAAFLTAKGAVKSAKAETTSDIVGAADPSADLCDAAARGDIERLRALAERLAAAKQVASIDKGDYDKRTAIHLAASEGLLEVVKVLVEELGADHSPHDRWGGTPLDDAMRSAHSEVIDYLQSKGAKRGVHTSGSGAADPSADLCDAAAKGDIERLRALAAQGLSIDKGDYDKRTAIHLAASEGLLGVVKVLVEELGADHSPRDRWGNTPLDDALRTHHEALALYLRARGATRGERATESGALALQPSGSSLWVLPNALEKAFSGDLFAPIVVSEAAQEAAVAALSGWDADVVAIHEASGGHALLLIGQALLNHHGLYDALKLDRPTVRRFLLAVEAGYGVGRYHNATHGADVALSVHCFLSHFGLLGRLSKLELFAAIIAAICHDFNHPGTTNAHEVRVGSDRATRHSDVSVLERHHLHSTFTLLRHPPLDIFARLSPEDRSTARGLIVECVLATDLSQHVSHVSRLRGIAAAKGHAMNAILSPTEAWKSPFHDAEAVDVKTLLTTAVKWADLSHATKLESMHLKWTNYITQEFWALGDKERSMKVPISPLCDRERDNNIAKSQMGFFKFICIPLFSVVADLVDAEMVPWVRLRKNMAMWEKKALDEAMAKGV